MFTSVKQVYMYTWNHSLELDFTFKFIKNKKGTEQQ